MARAFGTYTHAQNRAQHNSEAYDETRRQTRRGMVWSISYKTRPTSAQTRLCQTRRRCVPMTAPCPVVVILQIIPVRFAPGSVPVDKVMLRSKEGVELKNESDEEDARLTEIAKQPLFEAAADEDAQASFIAQVRLDQRGPPAIAPSSSSRKAIPPKKEAPPEEVQPIPAPARKFKIQSGSNGRQGPNSTASLLTGECSAQSQNMYCRCRHVLFRPTSNASQLAL
ncbi:hypothetical protein K437DRAFT_296996 [Tilletiaria anomala UBC 951]|uniref:Uncharacterized protein n=1 Tax=Tilletiaria anomala (strain ATCC 24038 / CBS 436.72 / UBC 951) TaxID=1037660 RepID=A0A066V078_TILAU|nr:uncharacterized protein K437DRAFT_296996 [Tilletiaria anomala UBC 951]KDN34841.1 hypothetical protein K437DRAFT_296996 [Tilletiaria anomala UBC 951]